MAATDLEAMLLDGTDLAELLLDDTDLNELLLAETLLVELLLDSNDDLVEFVFAETDLEFERVDLELFT